MNRELIALLIETTLASSAALAAVLLLRRPMRAAFGAGAAYALWWLVPVALVAVLLPAPVQPAALMQHVAMVEPLQRMPLVSAESTVPWLMLLVAVWGAGVLAVAALQLWQQQRFLHRLGPLRIRLHGLRVAASSAGLPAVTGLIRPRIVLPADFLTRYDAHERALVVAHERQHIVRGDLPCNALVALLRCMYWFNPLLHLAVARYRQDQELACDARVLARHPRARRSYAQAMLKTQLDNFALPVGCHWHTHPIKERIAMLKRPSPRRWQTGLSSVLLLTLFAGGGYAAWAQQPAVDADRVASEQPAKAPVAATLTASTVDESVRDAELPYGEDRPPPRYPAEAAHERITGKVVVIASFDATGAVTDASIEKSNPVGVFDEVSLEAVRKWKFIPAMEHGKPVAGRMRIPIDFDMDPPASHDDASPSDVVPAIKGAMTSDAKREVAAQPIDAL